MEDFRKRTARQEEEKSVAKHLIEMEEEQPAPQDKNEEGAADSTGYNNDEYDAYSPWG